MTLTATSGAFRGFFIQARIGGVADSDASRGFSVNELVFKIILQSFTLVGLTTPKMLFQRAFIQFSFSKIFIIFYNKFLY